MEQLFPGLEVGSSTRDALDAALDPSDGLDLVRLGTDQLEALTHACKQAGARVAVPADAAAATAVARAVMAGPSSPAAGPSSPVVVRVDDRPTPVVYDAPPPFSFGRAERVREGGDVTILATGLMVAAAVVAHERLAQMGVAARVLDMMSLRPLDEDAIAAAARETGALVTVEEARTDGGLGSAVAQVVMARHPVPMEHLGLDDGAGGGAGALLEAGLTAAHIMGAVHDVLERKG